MTVGVKDNTFEIPGGHVEKGESYLDGAKREFFEETGIKISNLKILKRAPNRIIYSCKLKTNIVKLSDEHIGFKFKYLYLEFPDLGMPPAHDISGSIKTRNFPLNLGLLAAYDINQINSGSYIELFLTKKY